MIYVLKDARKGHDDGLIYHEIAGEESKIYRNLRVGLSWPEDKAPAYFCVIAQKHRQNEYKRYPLVFITEGQALDGHSLLAELIDQYKLLICSEIRADMRPEKRIFRDIFHNYCVENGVKNVYLSPAPWPNEFAYGLSLISDWIAKKSIEIDKDSTLAKQIARMPRDLKAYSDHPEQEFFAINALRYLLGSFIQYPRSADTMKDIDYGDWYNFPGFYRGIDI